MIIITQKDDYRVELQNFLIVILRRFVFEKEENVKHCRKI